MSKASLVVLALLCATAASAAEQPAARVYTLELLTSVTAPMFAMPAGMPQMPGMPDFGGKPSRTISGSAEYAVAAVEPIHVTVPSSLGLAANRLKLSVSKFEMPEMPSNMPPQRGQATGRMEVDMTTKVFWHPETAHGPLTSRIKMDVDLSARPGTPGAVPQRYLDRVQEQADRTAEGSDAVNREGAPGDGDYVLNTGGFTMPLPGFLQPIKVTKPASIMEINPAQAIELVWEPDTLARGYIVHARGMVMENQKLKEMILWVSTESTPPERVREGYEVATTIADDVRRKILLPPGSTRCTIPGGLFGEVNMLMITITAVGDDFTGKQGDCVLKGRIRSEWSANRMKGMGAGMMPGGFDASGYGADGEE